MIRMYLFPFSLLIYKQKEVCMWKRIKTTVLMEGVVDYSNYYWQYTCSFVFILSISVLWLLKRHLWIPVKIGGKKADLLWLDRVIPVEEVWLFFSSPASNIYWFIALGTHPFRERHFWIALQKTFKLHLWKYHLEISAGEHGYQMQMLSFFIIRCRMQLWITETIR